MRDVSVTEGNVGRLYRVYYTPPPSSAVLGHEAVLPVAGGARSRETSRRPIGLSTSRGRAFRNSTPRSTLRPLPRYGTGQYVYSRSKANRGIPRGRSSRWRQKIPKRRR